ncbi:MAG: protoheme IX farnesyltransferase, partial [Parasphingorhabdus sp.]
AICAIAPYALGATGLVYGVAAIILSLLFSALSFQVMISSTSEPGEMVEEKRLFKFSIFYLFVLFAALVADRMVFG